ncbi:AgmX/PglI C-terminal domain-containing protein [Marinobacter sp.]|uniref:AgmX/PglI C-terminal domain-containing protein n=1 Tax=Marinobacter sp. TaxID=50741 RepID=UPI003569DE34
MAEKLARNAGAQLPWSRDQAESLRFGVIVVLVLGIFLVPALLIPFLDVPEIDRAEAEQIPPRLAKLIEPPKPVEMPEPVPEPEPEPEVVIKEVEPRPQQQPEPTSEVVVPPVQTTEQARETASRSGLFAMKDRLRAMTRSDPALADRSLSANVSNTDVPGLSAQLSGDAVLAGSGGVESREGPAHEVTVAGHQVSEIEAPEESVAKATPVAKPARSKVRERAMSNIRQVFDTQKSVLYSLYNRELRKDPTLEGKVTLELIIEPDGSVSACKVVASDLRNPALEQRIAMRVQMFDFGAANVEARKVQFPIDFLPG